VIRPGEKWSLGADWLIAAGAYPGFCSMKRLGVSLLPLNGMLVHRRSLPRNLFGFPNSSPVPIYTPGWREALWELSVLPKNTTVSPARAPFLISPEMFSHPENRSKILNLMITELFYLHILNTNRGSLHTRSFRRIHFSRFRCRWTKNGFTGPKRFLGFRETGLRARTQTARSGVERTKHEATAPPRRPGEPVVNHYTQVCM